MAEPLPVRVYAARRAALESRLCGSGMAQDVAEEWLGAWEAYAAEVGLDRDARDYWQRGGEWIETGRHRGH